MSHYEGKFGSCALISQLTLTSNITCNIHCSSLLFEFNDCTCQLPLTTELKNIGYLLSGLLNVVLSTVGSAPMDRYHQMWLGTQSIVSSPTSLPKRPVPSLMFFPPMR